MLFTEMSCEGLRVFKLWLATLVRAAFTVN